MLKNRARVLPEELFIFIICVFSSTYKCHGLLSYCHLSGFLLDAKRATKMIQVESLLFRNF